LSSFLIPWASLPEFLEANAQRLLYPTHYIEEQGWLQFSHNLRYCIKNAATKPKVSAIYFEDEAYQANSYDYIRLITQAYVSCGSGGYRERFKKLGISPLELEISPLSLREILWNRAQVEGPFTQSPLDSRLQVEES